MGIVPPCPPEKHGDLQISNSARIASGAKVLQAGIRRQGFRFTNQCGTTVLHSGRRTLPCPVSSPFGVVNSASFLTSAALHINPEGACHSTTPAYILGPSRLADCMAAFCLHYAYRTHTPLPLLGVDSEVGDGSEADGFPKRQPSSLFQGKPLGHVVPVLAGK